MGSLNSDGSVKLGTVRTELLLKLGLEQGKDKDELDAVKEMVKSASETMEAAAKRLNALQIIVPLVPEDTASPKHPFKVEQVVCYFKRDNPTKTMTPAQAKKKVELERKTTLMNAMRELSRQQVALNEFLKAGAITAEQFGEENDKIAAELQKLADTLLS